MRNEEEKKRRGRMWKTACLIFLFAIAGCDKADPGAAKPASTSAATATATSTARAPVRPIPAWDGKYVYSWSSEPGPSGAAPSVAYKIAVENTGGAYKVTIEADGTQTMTRMTGDGKPEGDKLLVLFAECGQDDMSQCNLYSKGDTLLTLVRKEGGVWLQFGKMSAPDGKTKELKPDK